METLQSLGDKIKSVKKTNSEAGVDQISTSNLKLSPSQQPNDLPVSLNTQPDTQALDEPIETEFCGPSLPPQFGQRFQSKIGSDKNSE